jgi:hypothetical protein
MKTPVALIIFNRTDTTEKVFEAIRQAQPLKLLVIADGPRQHKADEIQKCAATRAIIDRVDWDCEVSTNYSNINLGCKSRITSGINWVFEQVEEAIILEDDCLPDPTFFTFCEEMLERYKSDTRIMVISGSNYQFGHQRTSDSYYFSRYPHCWGWATWRRSWQYFDEDMKLWTTVSDGNWLRDMLNDDSAVKFWQKTFESVYNGTIGTAWSYQWTFACWIQSGLAILPNVNLISNIGFGAGATHTTDPNNKLANMSAAAISLPLQHPQFVVRDSAADRYTHKNIFDFSLPVRLKNALDRYGIYRSSK